MSEFENAIPENEQELKDRTDEAIREVGALPDEELGQVAGGFDDGAVQDGECTSKSQYGCINEQCDTSHIHDCPSDFDHFCEAYYYCTSYAEGLDIPQ